MAERWRVELNSPQPGSARTRYAVFQNDALRPLFILDNRDAEDMLDGLILALSPDGYVVESSMELPESRVAVRVVGGRMKIETQGQGATLTRSDAEKLFQRLAAALGREPNA